MNYRILVALAVLAALVSVLLVSEATAGVWMIGVAVLFAAFARISQAEQHARGPVEKGMTVKEADRILKEHAK